MGARKRISAEKRKSAKAATCVAKFTSRPTSPRKMRLVVDTIRGMEVEKAINSLTFTQKECANDIKKVLLSAVSNWEQKFGNSADANLYIKTITVDSARMMKRFLPAPMGRAYRIRKRSNHLTLELGARNLDVNTTETQDNQ
jgi:large subunit ribosomal protein L22